MSDEHPTENTNEVEVPTETQTQPADPYTSEAEKQPDQETETQQTNDGLLNAQDETPDSGEQEKPEDKEASILGAPEDGYKFDFFADGNNPEALKGFTEAAKELNLSNDAAQKLLGSSIEGLKSKLKQERETLKQTALEDKELNFTDPSVSNRANSAYKRYFGQFPELQAKLRAYNLDVDPQMLAVLKTIGGDVSEGGFVSGNKGVASDPNDFRKFFPASKMNR